MYYLFFYSNIADIVIPCLEGDPLFHRQSVRDFSFCVDVIADADIAFTPIKYTICVDRGGDGGYVLPL